MNRWLRTLVAVAGLALASAACSDSGVSPVEPAAGARFSGGYSVGGNDVTPPPPPATTTSGTTTPTTTVQDPEEGTGGTDSRSGGYSVGGN